MILLIILLLCLLILLSFCQITSHKGIILTPQFGFNVGFIFSVSYSLFWVEKWSLEISMQTFFVILGGNFLFTIISVFVQKIGYKIKIKKRITAVYNKEDYIQTKEIAINVESWKLIVFLIFQIVVFGSLILFVVAFSGNSNLSDAIYAYRHASAIANEKINMPFFLKHFRNISVSSGYIWGYILVHSFIYKYKVHKMLLILNVILSILNGMLFGSRTLAFQLIVAIIVQAYFLIKKKNFWRGKIKIKDLVLFCFVGIVCILGFQQLGNLLGRNSTRDMFEYIAIYLSGEIKNLDIFIRKNQFGADMYNCQTLIGVANFLSGKLWFPEWSHGLDQPFQHINGYSLGNVATTYYSYIYDMGYWGVIVFTIIMAVLSSWFYIVAVKKINETTNEISLSFIVYTYLYFTFIFSFFSNKFFESVAYIAFVYYLIYWYLIKKFLNIRINKKRNQ